jgi:ribosomal protein L12E/L44/L45/RPP1/RPP2
MSDSALLEAMETPLNDMLADMRSSLQAMPTRGGSSSASASAEPPPQQSEREEEEEEEEKEEEEAEEEEATRQRPIYLLVETQAALPRTGQA